MMQILNLNTKTIENKHFIHYFKRFPQTSSVCFVMPTSKHNYQCFLIVVQSFSACTFSRIVDCFQNKLSSVWSTFSFLTGPDKKPTQNRAKQQNKRTFTAKRSQEFSPTKRRQRARLFFGALSQGLCADWLLCIAYCIFWHLIGSEKLSYSS